MSVGVEGDLDTGVAHLVADVFRALPLGDQHRREEVPEVMKPDTGKPGARRDSAAAQLRDSMEAIEKLGCLLKDLDIGLADFPTLYRGREAYLCWKLGETAIRFWHGVDEGFAGRKPIDRDFVENHGGETD